MPTPKSPAYQDLRSEGFGGQRRKAEEEHLGGVLTCAAGKGCGPQGTRVLCPKSEASQGQVDWCLEMRLAFHVLGSVGALGGRRGPSLAPDLLQRSG